MKIIITGGAGFIGSWVGHALLLRKDDVTVIDDFSSTIYESSLKEARVSALLNGARIVRDDIVYHDRLIQLFQEIQPDLVLHCAAIAGIRYAQKDPLTVTRVNVEGTVAVFEAARHGGVSRVLYASSSSVYGRNEKMPFHEDDPVERPSSLYAATKRECELIAEVYRHTAGIASTGMRFFTVYGPWGRPDMAIFSFTKKIFAGETIELFGEGNAGRDFTSIHDIVRGVLAVIDAPNTLCPIVNLGNAHPSTNGELFSLLKTVTGKSVQAKLIPLPSEDVIRTHADIRRAKDLYGWAPRVALEEGVQEFVSWYRGYYGV